MCVLLNVNWHLRSMKTSVFWDGWYYFNVYAHTWDCTAWLRYLLFILCLSCFVFHSSSSFPSVVKSKWLEITWKCIHIFKQKPHSRITNSCFEHDNRPNSFSFKVCVFSLLCTHSLCVWYFLQFVWLKSKLKIGCVHPMVNLTTV